MTIARKPRSSIHVHCTETRRSGRRMQKQATKRPLPSPLPFDADISASSCRRPPRAVSRFCGGGCEFCREAAKSAHTVAPPHSTGASRSALRSTSHMLLKEYRYAPCAKARGAAFLAPDIDHSIDSYKNAATMERDGFSSHDCLSTCLRSRYSTPPASQQLLLKPVLQKMLPPTGSKSSESL